MSLPAVSCVCPTFGRPHLLEEAIESFLRQSYAGSRELLVLNDDHRQMLYFDHPKVSVLNAGRAMSIGEKRNSLIEKAKGEIIIVWDDDDISLPNRIRQAVTFLTDGGHFFRPSMSWFMSEGNAPKLMKRTISWPQSAYTREAWEKAGGYPDTSRGEDRIFAERLRGVGISVEFNMIAPNDAAFIYRMWSSNPHASFDLSRAQIMAALSDAAPTGKIYLKPRWKVDYYNLITHHLLNGVYVDI